MTVRQRSRRAVRGRCPWAGGARAWRRRAAGPGRRRRAGVSESCEKLWACRGCGCRGAGRAGRRYGGAVGRAAWRPGGDGECFVCCGAGGACADPGGRGGLSPWGCTWDGRQWGNAAGLEGPGCCWAGRAGFTGLDAVGLAWAAFEDGAEYWKVSCGSGLGAVEPGSRALGATGGCHRAALGCLDLARASLPVVVPNPRFPTPRLRCCQRSCLCW